MVLKSLLGFASFSPSPPLALSRSPFYLADGCFVSDPDLLSQDLEPAFKAEYRSGFFFISKIAIFISWPP